MPWIVQSVDMILIMTIFPGAPAAPPRRVGAPPSSTPQPPLQAPLPDPSLAQRRDGTRAGRNPRKLLRLPAVYLLRYADRAFRGSMSQLPPRRTRSAASEGPTGSTTSRAGD